MTKLAPYPSITPSEAISILAATGGGLGLPPGVVVKLDTLVAYAERDEIIRQRYKAGESNAALAAELGVTQSTLIKRARAMAPANKAQTPPPA